jgi:S-adenosylmethionine/arginine decarboxylase-like enzyme
MSSWGYHLILDVKACHIGKATDSDYIGKFVKHLVKMIDMVPYGEPQVVHFADNTDKAGWTVIQLITTSSIVGHFLDDSGDLYLDVFSCKDFDEDVVKQVLTNYFEPESIKTTFIRRKA